MVGGQEILIEMNKWVYLIFCDNKLVNLKFQAKYYHENINNNISKHEIV